MKIVVAGGTGLIGASLVRSMGEHGHEAVAACRGSGVDAFTGAGLDFALDGAAVVVDVTGLSAGSSCAAAEFFRTSTGNLLAAGVRSGVVHHVVMSMVGVDDLVGSEYLRAKLAQEQLVVASGVPYSIVRSTQVLEGILRVADAATRGATVRLPPVRVQPVAAEDLAAAVSDISTCEPINGIVEVAGPDSVRLDELVRTGLGGRNDGRVVLTAPEAQYLGAQLSRGQDLLPNPGATLGTARLLDWLHQDASCHVDLEIPSGERSLLGATALLRDRIDPRHLPPEALLDSLFERAMHPVYEETEDAKRCEVILRPERDDG